MASSFFNLTLDTLAPSGATLAINGGASYTTSASVALAIGLSDTPTTGYTMKIWGIAGAETEGEATWEAFANSKSVNLPAGDGLKTVYVAVRDNVHNEAAPVSSSITLDTAVPVVTISGPDVDVISKVPGKDTAAFSFVVDKPFTEYTVRVVPATTSLHTAGTQIPMTGGSTNLSGVGDFPAATAINGTITGADLDSVSSGDGEKIIKIFAKDDAGNWSVA